MNTLKTLETTPRPIVGNIYSSPILHATREVLAITEHFVVTDKKTIYKRDQFARLFMGWRI